MSVFYDDLVGLDDIHSELADFDLSFKEHYDLLNLVDSTLHNEVLNVILIILPVEHHESFLKEINDKPNDENHLIYLRQFDSEIDGKIREASHKAKTKIKEDIKKVKK